MIVVAAVGELYMTVVSPKSASRLVRLPSTSMFDLGKAEQAPLK
jgi:hypothetical protein